MKMKKIMAICLLLLLMAIPSSTAEAGVANDNVQNDEGKSVIYTAFLSDGSSTTDKLLVSEEDVVELKNHLSTLLKEIINVKNWGGLNSIIDKFKANKNPIISKILQPLGIFNLFRSRAFVISLGHGYAFNPFKNNLKIRKKIDFWHYSSGKFLKARTVILKPLALKMKLLTGFQIGVMTHFIGLYIMIPRHLPEKSYTFFIGTARRINGIQILPNL